MSQRITSSLQHTDLLHVVREPCDGTAAWLGSDELTPGTTAGRAHKGTYPQVLVYLLCQSFAVLLQPSASVF